MNRMRHMLAPALGAMLLGSGAAVADEHFDIVLEGFQEVPAVSTSGHGTFRMRSSAPFDYELRYDGLEGDVLMAHIHLGQAGVNGGIMVWLCDNPGGPAPDPALPLPPLCGADGAVGTLTGGHLAGPAAQGIDPPGPTEVAEALRALRAGVTYVNVHTTRFPGGEIRGQLVRGVDPVDALRDDLEDLQDAVEGHSHEYLTGRGRGHNKVRASSSGPRF